MDEGFVLVIAGLLIGLVVAFTLAGLLATLLFGVQPRDAATFAGAAIVL
jgi:hypothetical protein